MKKILLLLLLMGCVMFGSISSDMTRPTSFSHVTIAETLSDPQYVGHGVILTGAVTADIGIGPLGWFRLKDTTGVISVVNLNALPEDHHLIELWATLHQLLAVGHTHVVVLVAKRWREIPAQGNPTPDAEDTFHNSLQNGKSHY